MVRNRNKLEEGGWGGLGLRGYDLVHEAFGHHFRPLLLFLFFLGPLRQHGHEDEEQKTDIRSGMIEIDREGMI